jgi:zinc transporter ZupT
LRHTLGGEIARNMNILIETLLISLCMLGLGLVPVFFPQLRKYSKFFYLFGTGALAGILFFDLIPDLFEMGGKSTLWGVAIVWLIYSLFHLFHLRQHKMDTVFHFHGQSRTFFLISMMGHCIASGMLLMVSGGYAGSLNRTIFFALFAHKAYESLAVSSVLLKNEEPKSRFFTLIIAYSMSLPLGVILAYAFRTMINEHVALLITSVAAGTLAGCLIFDFLLPSLHQVPNKRRALTWILIGLGITQLVMKSI